MQVRDADRDDVVAILAESHAIWGEGLGLDDYIAFNLGQMTSAWGRERHRCLVAAEGGDRVAALRLSTLHAEMDGRRVIVAGIGAMFTPPRFRGRGHAAALVRAAMDRARSAGHEAAMLMSQIGGAPFERLGFTALPAVDSGCLPFMPVPWPAEPSWLSAGDPESHVPGLRPFRTADLEDLVAIREEATRGQRFRLLRDGPAWEQVLLKADLYRQLRRSGGDHVWVIERRGRVIAYVALREARAALQWREHGARLGFEEALADLFWCAMVHARRMGVNRVDAWSLPAVVSSQRLYPVARRPQRDPVIMLRPLDPGFPEPRFADAEDCRQSWLDIF